MLYGGAEFSKDFDFVVLAEPDNLERLSQFVSEVHGKVIAVPPFEPGFLKSGHAVHFRAGAPGLDDVRIDVMATMRGVDPFEDLWNRRTTVELLPDLMVEVLSLPDLVQAKKTQRDKDWPMIRRLVDVHYLKNRSEPSVERISFWLRELRSPELLMELVCSQHNVAADLKLSPSRTTIIAAAKIGDLKLLGELLKIEEEQIRKEDQLYWRPLKAELERLRRKRARSL